MKYTWLAATASVAFIASGVVAQAQDKPRDEKPAAERSQLRPAAAPKAEPREAPRSAQTEERRTQPGTEQRKAEQPEQRKAEQPEQRKAEQPEQRKAEQPEQRKAEQPEQRKAEQPEQRKAEQPEQRKAEQPEKGAPARTGETGGRGQPKVVGKVQTSTEHATRVTDILMRNSHSENVSIDVNVGVRIPDSVTIYPLPAEVLAFAPEYNGYDYFIDNSEVVFVAPDSHEVVGMIEYEGRAAAVGDGTNVAGARPCPVDN